MSGEAEGPAPVDPRVLGLSPTQGQPGRGNLSKHVESWRRVSAGGCVARCSVRYVGHDALWRVHLSESHVRCPRVALLVPQIGEVGSAVPNVAAAV